MAVKCTHPNHTGRTVDQISKAFNAWRRSAERFGEPNRAILTAFCLSAYLATALLILSLRLLAAKLQLIEQLP
jgi:hypothetical protein